MTSKEYVECYLGHRANFNNGSRIITGMIVGYQNGNHLSGVVCIESEDEQNDGNNASYYQGAYGVCLLLPNLTGKIYVSSIEGLMRLPNPEPYPHKCPLCGSPALVRSHKSFDCSEGC